MVTSQAQVPVPAAAMCWISPPAARASEPDGFSSTISDTDPSGFLTTLSACHSVMKATSSVPVCPAGQVETSHSLGSGLASIVVRLILSLTTHSSSLRPGAPAAVNGSGTQATPSPISGSSAIRPLIEGGEHAKTGHKLLEISPKGGSAPGRVGTAGERGDRTVAGARS